MSIEFHPFAEIFPLLPDDELGELAADIKSFGLREPIWLYEGKILDGRNRYLACQRAKVQPEYRTYKGTKNGALSLVVSANVTRRHLTAAERAFAGSRISELRRGDNQHTARAASSASQAEIAEKIGTSEDSIQRASKVRKDGSKALQKAAESGEVSLKKAASVTKLPKREQLAAAKAPDKKPPESPQSDVPARPDDIDEEGALAAAEAEMNRTFDRLLAGDTDAKREIERLTKLVGTLESSRDGFMKGKAEMTKLLQAEQRKTAKLEKRIKELEAELVRLRKAAA